MRRKKPETYLHSFRYGILNSFSIGFQSLRASKPSTAEINARPELKKCKNIVRDWNLYEYSVVGVTSQSRLPCPGCLTKESASGSSTLSLTIQGNTEEAATEVIAQLKEIKPQRLYEYELKKMIAERIDKLTLSINP